MSRAPFPGTLPNGAAPPLPIPAKVQVAIRLDRVFDELSELRTVIERLSLEAPNAPHVDDDLWTGIAAIHEAIVKTRNEISSLHAKGVKNDQLFRATDELDAVVIQRHCHHPAQRRAFRVFGDRALDHEASHDELLCQP